MSSIWKTCLSKLEHEIPNLDFNTWIRPLQAIENENHLRLLAPNRFVLDWVNTHHFNKIEASINTFSKGKIRVTLEIGTKQSASSTARKPTKSSRPKPVKATEPELPALSYSLNATFNFDSFVAGQANQMAKNAALQVVDNIGTSYNPLLIYGASGMGKTHLMQAVGNAILEKQPKTRVLYLRSERFVQEMVKAFRERDINTFKEYYQTIDVLLLDDIQFFAGKNRSQEEFFHIFNQLLEQNKQVIMTCDKYPKEIIGLEERLKSRFASGLPVAIEPLDLETRSAIVTKKALLAGIIIPNEVAVFIGKHISNNVRELEGALRRVIASAEFSGQSVSLGFVREVLRDLISIKSTLISIDNIQKTVADYFKLKTDDLLSKGRKQTITRPRQIAMKLSRDLTKHSLPEIGKAFGGRDHTTVMNACKRVDLLKKDDHKINDDYQKILKSLSD